MRQMLPHMRLIFETDFRFRLQGFIGTAFDVKSIPTLILVDVKTGEFDWQKTTANGQCILSMNCDGSGNIKRHRLIFYRQILHRWHVKSRPWSCSIPVACVTLEAE